MLSREMKDSGIEWIGEIPKNWKMNRLKVALKKEKHIIDNYKNEPILSLTMNGVIQRDLINITGKMPTNFDGYQKIQKDNLIACLFDIDVTPRCIGIAYEDGLTSPAYTQFKVSKKYNKEYIFYYLLFMDNDKILVPISKSLRNTIRSEDFLNLKFCSPDFETQRKIANELKKSILNVNNIIFNTKQSIEELKKYKQSLITEVVTKGLDKNVEMKDSGIEWIGEIPKDWETVKLGNFTIKVNNKNTSLKEDNLLSLSYGEIIKKNINTSDGLLPENFESYNIVKPGNIVLRMTDLQNDHKSLRTGLVKQKGIITSAYITLKNTHDLLIDNMYLHLILHSFDIKKGFYGMGSGVRQNVTFNDLKKIELCLPDINEQKEIVKYLDSKTNIINKLVSEKQMIINEYEAYKKSLIYEYVTGKKEVGEEEK